MAEEARNCVALGKKEEESDRVEARRYVLTQHLFRVTRPGRERICGIYRIFVSCASFRARKESLRLRRTSPRSARATPTGRDFFLCSLSSFDGEKKIVGE